MSRTSENSASAPQPAAGDAGRPGDVARKPAAADRYAGAHPPWVRHVLFLAALSALLAGIGLGSWPLLDPDEPRTAMVSRLMVEGGDWLAPHLPAIFHHEYPADPVEGATIAYWDKPPLYFWLTAAAMEVLGPTDLAARLVAALSFMATVLLVYVAGRTMWGPRAGFWAAVVMAVAPMPLAFAHIARMDGLLVMLMTVMLLAILRLISGTVRPWAWVGVLYVAAGLGVLTKGPEAVVFPAVAVLLTAALTRRWRDILLLKPVAGVIITAVVAAPWFIAMSLRYPAAADGATGGYLGEFLIHQHFGRASGDLGQKLIPGLLLGYLLAGLLPWTIFLPGAIARVARGGWRGLCGQPAAVLLLAWAVLIALVFSLMRTGQPQYVLPALPPLAILVGAYVADRRKLRTTAVLMTVVMALGAAALLVADPFDIAGDYSTYNQVVYIKNLCEDNPGDAVVIYSQKPYSIVWYLGSEKNVDYIMPGGDSGEESTVKKLAAKLNEPVRTYCLLQKRGTIDRLEDPARPLVAWKIKKIQSTGERQHTLIVTNPLIPAEHPPEGGGDGS